MVSFPALFRLLRTNPVQFLLKFPTANHLHTALLDGLHNLPYAGNILCVFESLDFFFGELSNFRVGESAKLVVLAENPVDFVFIFRTWYPILHANLNLSLRRLVINLRLRAPLNGMATHLPTRTHDPIHGIRFRPAEVYLAVLSFC